jgi:hypothetical protein
MVVVVVVAAAAAVVVVEGEEEVAVGVVVRIQVLDLAVWKDQCELSHLYYDVVELEACILPPQFLLHSLHDSAVASQVECHVVEVEEEEVCWKISNM